MVHPTKQTKGEIVSQNTGNIYGNNQYKSGGITKEDNSIKSLSEIGITRNESSVFQI